MRDERPNIQAEPTPLTGSRLPAGAGMAFLFRALPLKAQGDLVAEWLVHG